MKRRTLLTSLSALAVPAILRAQDQPAEDITDTATGKKLSVRDLIDRLEQADIILIGERHGFAPHQDREAFILQALAERGRYPTLALEMLEPAQEPVIEAYRKENPEYARGLGIALDWSNTGWPAWSFYEPVFQAAFTARLDIRAADLPRDEQRRIEREGTPDRPDDMSIIESWQDSMMKAHCGLIDEDRAFRLALKQWKRDQNMADVASRRDVVLIAGRTHIEKLDVSAHTNRSIKLSFADKNEPRKPEGILWRQHVEETKGRSC